jgi:hypothetical protein
LPIIKGKKRTIKTVKKGARNFHEHDPIQTGQSRQKQPIPPTPPWGFYENKALSCFSLLHPKKTKKLQTPIRRRNRHFAPFLGLIRRCSIHRTFLPDVLARRAEDHKGQPSAFGHSMLSGKPSFGASRLQSRVNVPQSHALYAGACALGQ